MANRPKAVANWTPKMPTRRNESLMNPNARDMKDALQPESPFVQAVGKSGKPSGPFGKRGRET